MTEANRLAAEIDGLADTEKGLPTLFDGRCGHPVHPLGESPDQNSGASTIVDGRRAVKRRQGPPSMDVSRSEDYDGNTTEEVRYG